MTAGIGLSGAKGGVDRSDVSGDGNGGDGTTVMGSGARGASWAVESRASGFRAGRRDGMSGFTSSSNDTGSPLPMTVTRIGGDNGTSDMSRSKRPAAMNSSRCTTPEASQNRLGHG
jgi:hypothetical protein